jgi:NMD protein affecting ribosome stability and mRNA decay
MKKDRPRPVELVCGDCGRPVNPTEAPEVRLATNVMKVCPSCFATRQELDELLG